MSSLEMPMVSRFFALAKNIFFHPEQSFVRFILAITVVYGHFMFEITNLGNVAVFGFYTLSGFLITSAMRRSYDNGTNGFLRFWQNRFWRLYPTYAAAACLALIGILAAPEAFSTARYAMVIPSTISEWLPQITIVGLLGLEQATAGVRPLPPAWSLGIEIIYYLLISLIIARSVYIALFFALLAAISFVYMALTDGYSGVYLTYHGPAIAFMLGALSSYAKQHLAVTVQPERMRRLSCFAFVTLLLVLFGRELLVFIKVLKLSELQALFAFLFTVEANILFLLLGSIATAFFCLVETKSETRSKEITFLGDLSYPLFLIHWPALGASYGVLQWALGDAALITVTTPAITAEFATLFLATRVLAVMLALALSCLIVVYIERALVPLRNHVRGNNQFRAAPTILGVTGIATTVQSQTVK